MSRIPDTKASYSAKEVDAMFVELMALTNKSMRDSNQKLTLQLTEIQTSMNSIKDQFEVIYQSQAEIMQIAKAALQINMEGRGKS